VYVYATCTYLYHSEWAAVYSISEQRVYYTYMRMYTYTYPASTLGTHALVQMHSLEYSTGCVSQSLLGLRAFRWHVCACVQFLPGLLTG